MPVDLGFIIRIKVCSHAFRDVSGSAAVGIPRLGAGDRARELAGSLRQSEMSRCCLAHTDRWDSMNE